MSTWRDTISVHPLADTFPMMSDGELQELAEDIRKNGQREPVIFVLIDGKKVLVDGRNRLAACFLVGREPVWQIADLEEAAIEAFVLSRNVHRRHLTPEERQARLDAVIAANPTASNRVIGEKAGVDKNTAAKRRKKITTGAPHQLKTVGKDGRTRTSSPKKPTKAPEQQRAAAVSVSSQVEVGNAAEPAEDSVEKRKAEVSEGNTAAVDEFKECCARLFPKMDRVDLAEVRSHVDRECSKYLAAVRSVGGM